MFRIKHRFSDYVHNNVRVIFSIPIPYFHRAKKMCQWMNESWRVVFCVCVCGGVFFAGGRGEWTGGAAILAFKVLRVNKFHGLVLGLF